MPLYAGVCETNITPPLGVCMSGYAFRPSGAVGVLDELYARAIVFDNGELRIALLSIDVIALDLDLVDRVRDGIAGAIGTPRHAVMLSCTHTHGGPCVKSFRGMGARDEAYCDVLVRKLIGVAKQASDSLRPAHVTYGETSAQIGVNRRETIADGSVSLGTNWGGPVAPLVQTLAVNGADGRMFAVLFSHACHPTTLTGDNLHITADWPGAACARMKERFRSEGKETGIRPDAIPLFLQGCCGDINPHPRGDRADVQAHGLAIAEAAHTARWNAHGRMDETLEAEEVTVELPLAPPSTVEYLDGEIARWESKLAADRASNAHAGHVALDEGMIAWARDARRIALSPDRGPNQSFAIQRLLLGGLAVIGFPGEMFVDYQLELTRLSPTPLMTLGYVNGCWGYLPTAKEFKRGGYEVDEAYKFYGTSMVTPECEAIVMDASRRLLGI